MTEAIFGLIGVVVGGLVTGWVSYLVERLRENRAARTAAWLVLADLTRSLVAMKRGRNQSKWTGFADAIRLGRWEQSQELLFSTMRLDDLNAVYAAHRNLEAVAEYANPSAIPSGLLDDAVSAAEAATFVLNRVGAYGPKRRLCARVAYWLRYRQSLDEFL